MNTFEQDGKLYAAFEWQASQTLQKAEIVATGQPVKALRRTDYPIADLTSDQRRAVLDAAGMSVSPRPVFDHAPSLEDALQATQAYRVQQQAKWAAEREAQAEQQRKREVARACIAEIDALEQAGDLAGLRAYRRHIEEGLGTAMHTTQAYNDVERARDRAIFALKRQAAEAEKAAWVEAHGSDHLKRACAAGYDCQRLYVTERAAQEAPGFTVDFSDNATWKDRACPSVAALDAREAADQLGIGKALIVWLTAEPLATINDTGYEDDLFEPVEAVVIRSYLARYDLVQIIE